MKSKMIKLGLALMALLTIAGLVACDSPQAVTEPEKATVSRSNIVQSISADGSLSLPLDRKLTFGTSGTIDRINVVEGAKATKGQVLGRLDTSSLERAVKTAELAINSAEVDRKQAETGIKTAQLDLEQATDNYRKITYPYTYSTFAFDVPAALDYINSVDRAISDIQKSLQTGLTADQYNEIARHLKDAQDNLTNARERLARGSGQDVFDNRMLAVKDFWTLRAAQLTMEKAQAALDNAKNAASKVQLASDKAKYDLDTAKDMLTKAVITAPFDGVVADVTVKAGDTLTAVDYTRTIIELVDPSHMELTINVNEMDLPGFKVGQDAAIFIDALPGQKLTGKVVFVSPLSNVAAGVVLYEAKVGFDVPTGLGLSAGMSATANIITAKRDNALVLPIRAINKSNPDNSTVKILANGQVEERKVVTGISDNFNTEIVSGLNENDTVLVGTQIKLSL